MTCGDKIFIQINQFDDPFGKSNQQEKNAFMLLSIKYIQQCDLFTLQRAGGDRNLEADRDIMPGTDTYYV